MGCIVEDYILIFLPFWLRILKPLLCPQFLGQDKHPISFENRNQLEVIPKQDRQVFLCLLLLVFLSEYGD
jgi:hypothetical protein